MIQRVQTIYLALAVALCLICLPMKIGVLSSLEGSIVTVTCLGVPSECINLGYGKVITISLCAVLILSMLIGAYAISAWRNRRMQARLCLFDALLMLGWYILYVALWQIEKQNVSGWTFSPHISAIIPAIIFVLFLLARRAILADEKLVRAADRIR